MPVAGLSKPPAKSVRLVQAGLTEEEILFSHTGSVVYPLVLALVSTLAWAQPAGKTGEERKTYMRLCLSGESTDKALTPQQRRMKECNAQAASQALTGGQRKAFMSGCLKNEAR